VKEHGQRYPIRWLADEMSVDRLTLRKRLGAAGRDTAGKGKGFTLAEAVYSWTARGEAESARNRKAAAEAERAEIETAEKLGRFVLRDEHKHVLRELAIQTRVVVENASYIAAAARQRLSKEISAVQISVNAK
jgi:hypothetical protein